jgi:hypothetical protein
MGTDQLVFTTVELELLRIQTKLHSWGFKSVRLTINGPLCNWIEWGCDPESGVQKMTESMVCDMASIIQEILEESGNYAKEMSDMGFEQN